MSDFNKDGSPDLAVANNSSDNASILLGTQTGDFTAASTSPEPAGNGPVSVGVADFNKDGNPDLAVANDLSNDVTILLGSRSGDFTAPATSPEAAGSVAADVAVADFNRDGNPDLAVANLGSNDVSILLGTGSGDFIAAPTSPEVAGTGPISVAVGDFNRDRDPDLAVANRDGDNVSILLGSRVGDFTPVSTSPEPTGSQPLKVIASDFNRDGNSDLALTSDGSTAVTILLGSRSGDFSAAPTSPEPVGATQRGVAVGDFNKDGQHDLAVVSPFFGVTILLGSRSGDFAAAATSPEVAGTAEVHVAVDDFNKDGRSDLAVSNSGSHDVSILLGT